MLIPKSKTACIALSDKRALDFEISFVPECTKFLNKAAEKASQYKMMISQGGNKNATEFYRYHRTNVFLSGKEGILRLGIFLNKMLNEPFRGGLIKNQMPIPVHGHTIDPENPLEVPKSTKKVKSVEENNFKAFVKAVNYLSELPALNEFNPSLINYDELEANVMVVINMPYFAGETASVTIYNLMIRWVHTAYKTCIETDGHEKTEYKVINLFKSLVNNDFEELIYAYVSHKTYAARIRAIQDFTVQTPDYEVNETGPTFTMSFFSKITETVVDSALAETLDLVELHNKFASFDKLRRQYSVHAKALLRVGSKYPDVELPIVSELMVGYDVGEVTLDRVQVKQLNDRLFIEHANVVEIFKQVINEFYRAESDESGSHLPLFPMVQLVTTEREGTTHSYSMHLTDPYYDVTHQYQKFDNGWKMGESLAKAPSPDASALVSTQYRDESLKDFVITPLDDDENNPYILRVIRNNLRDLVVYQTDPELPNYRVSYSQNVVIIVPPKDKITDCVLHLWYPEHCAQYNIKQEEKLYRFSQFSVDELPIQYLPFAHKLSDIAAVQGTTDPQLGALYENRLKRLMSARPVGPQISFYPTQVSRYAIMNIVAQLACADPVAATQALTWTKIDPMFEDETSGTRDLLQPIEILAEIELPRKLRIPFPIRTDSISSTTSKRYAAEAVSHKTTLVEKGLTPGSVEMYDAQNDCVFFKRKYTPLTKDFKLATIGLEVRKNAIPEEFAIVSTTPNSYFLRIGAGNQRPEDGLLYDVCLFGLCDQDFMDPYPAASAADTIFHLQSMIITDFLLSGCSSADGYAINADLRFSANAIIGIDTFIREYLRLEGRPSQYGSFATPYTWKEFLQHSAKTVKAANAYLDKRAEILGGSNTIKYAKRKEISKLRNADLNNLASVLQKEYFAFMKGMTGDLNPYWSSAGFKVAPLFCGDIYALLSDKFNRVSRQSMPPAYRMDALYVNVPLFQYAEARHQAESIIHYNTQVLLGNLINKIKYMGV